MSRIPYPDASQLSDEKTAFLASLSPVLNISRMSMHMSDNLWAGWVKFARTVAYEIAIDKDLRELLILRVANLSNSDYEVLHHYQAALDAGATPAKCAAMETGDFGALDPREVTMATFVTELVENVSARDETLEMVRKHFSDEDVFGVVALVGAYMTTARIIATGGVQAEVAGDASG